MQRSRLFIVFIALFSLFFTAGWQSPSEPAPLDDASLKTMLTNLGYEVKEPGTGTYEVPMSASGLNIPTRVFISKSKTKIWLSVALMAKDDTAKLTRDDLQAILEKNVEVGPCHFMIENGWLKLKVAVDNRAVTPAILRTELDYLAARVADSKTVWQKPAP